MIFDACKNFKSELPPTPGMHLKGELHRLNRKLVFYRKSSTFVVFQLEKGGIWYLLSRFDEMAMDTYAMVGRISTVSENTAVLNLRQSA